jgi:hypothetical protein
LIAKIARENNPEPANPDGHCKVSNDYMPVEKEAQGVEQGNQAENDPGND